MPRHDADTAQCLVFTWKEGVLSRVGHDLALRATRFEVDVERAPGDPPHPGPSVRAKFDATSLAVQGALRGGDPEQVDRDALSAGDRRDIERNLAREVLEVQRHPEITFTSTRIVRAGEEWRVEGELYLHGHHRPLAFPVHAAAGCWVAEVRLHQPDWGIRPYSAMLGALKVKPDVLVRISLPITQ